MKKEELERNISPSQQKTLQTAMIPRLSCTPIVRSIILGQVASILIAVTGVTSEELANRGFRAPTLQLLFNYVILGTCGAVVWWWWGGKLKMAWWAYAVLAFFDLEANAVVVLAYQYASIQSVTLLDCLSVPGTMVLTWWFLGAKYTRWHLLAALLCLCGIGVLVGYDSVQGITAGKNEVLGDLLCVLGAALYSGSNVVEEFLLKKSAGIEHTSSNPNRDTIGWRDGSGIVGRMAPLLAMLGGFGTFFAIVQIAIFERDEVIALQRVGDRTSILLIVAFVIALAIFYVVAGLVLGEVGGGGAAAFNISLLTSDALAIFCAILIFHTPLHWAYFVSLAITVIGLVWWNQLPSVDSPESSQEDTQDTAGLLPSPSSTKSLPALDQSRLDDSKVR